MSEIELIMQRLANLERMQKLIEAFLAQLHQKPANAKLH